MIGQGQLAIAGSMMAQGQSFLTTFGLSLSSFLSSLVALMLSTGGVMSLRPGDSRIAGQEYRFESLVGGGMATIKEE